jgi:integrase
MATLTVDKSGKTAGYTIQWYDGDRRRTLYLGGRRYNRKTAERIKEVIETLVYHRWNGTTVLDKATAHWLKSASDHIRSKLEKAGLIVVTAPKTCQMLWDTYLKHKTDVKASTVRAYQSCRTVFFNTFSPDESIEKITPDRLLEWKVALLSEYADASVAGYLKSVKAIFSWAVEQEWLTKNPMARIPRGSFINRDKDRIITMEEYTKLLNACPNQEWRTIIALARIGGLRCPSELKRLRWSDINWAENRFIVRSPKTERYEGHRERVVPLFPELRTELDRLLRDKTDGEFVVVQYQKTNWVLGEPFQAIARLAGLGTIIRPFDNMRMSRSNEVRTRWGESKERLWIGHSSQVMREHYLVLSDEEFAEAAS